MELVELYKVRWPFARMAVIAVLIALATAGFASHATVEVNGQRPVLGVGLSMYAAFPMIFAVVFAFWLGTSLSRERTTLALSWTKPLPRWNLATRTIAVDLAALIALYAVAWLLVIAVLVSLAQPLLVDASLWPIATLSLGVAVMWYALTAAATAGWEQSRFAIPGLIGASIALLILATLPLTDPAHTVIAILNVLNPFSYLSAVRATGSSVTATSLWRIDVPERALIVWMLSIALLAVATVVWSRKEA